MMLTIIIFDVMAVMLLCTHYTSGQSNISESTAIHRHKNYSNNDGNGLSEKSSATVFDLNESDTSVNRSQPRIVLTESVSDSASDQLLSKFRLAKYPRTNESRNRVWPLVKQGLLTAKNPYPGDSNREDIADRTIELWNIDSRSNRYNHQNMKSDKWAGHHASYDLTNSVVRNADTHLIGGMGLRSHYSFDNGAYYGPIAESSSTMHYRPSLRSPPIYPTLRPQTKITISKKEKFDWHTIGLLTLVKTGFIKLKLFGILKILFLLLFKFKLFLITIFIKFFLILKYSKLFKTLFLPLLILPLFLILMAVIFSTIISAMLLLPRESLNMMSPAPTSSLSNLLSSLISNLPSIPNSQAIPTQTGLIKSFTSDKFPIISKNVLDSRSGTFRLNDLSLNNKGGLEMLAKIEAALSVFQKLFDAEKFAERIACKISAAGKEGIMFDKIKRLLNNILSIFIAILKGKTYVKAYSYDNTDILINFSTPDSWTTWCMERYNCNITIISNTTETGL